MDIDIFLITYNRATCMQKTLDVLSNSGLKDYSITVLDNCSTDNTAQVARQYIGTLPNLKVISNKINIGGDANFMRAMELSNGIYTWVLCDDDEMDLSGFDDVLAIIKEGNIDLIHVGAHPDNGRIAFAGKIDTPRNLLNQSYPYFKFCSFMPCNIFKTAAFTKDMVKGYRNIGNAYPHMPFLIELFESDKPIYIAKNQLITAVVGNQGYDNYSFLYWWIGTCKLLKNKADVRLAYFDQWHSVGQRMDKFALDLLDHLRYIAVRPELVNSFFEYYFTFDDKVYIAIKRLKDGTYYRVLNKINRMLSKKSR